jgi:mediator of RNA polymerase II transcription subunit 6
MAPTADDAPVLTTTSWADKSWWSGHLRRETVLDYFAGSPFYDRTCLNEVLRMQKTLTPEDARDKLRRLPGTVYELDEARTEEVAPTESEPAHMLYVIRKLRRDGAGSEVSLRWYYVLDGLVYEAPTLASVLRARLLKVAWHLHMAWREAGLGEDEPTAGGGSRKRRRSGAVPTGGGASAAAQ